MSINKGCHGAQTGVDGSWMHWPKDSHMCVIEGFNNLWICNGAVAHILESRNPGSLNPTPLQPEAWLLNAHSTPTQRTLLFSSVLLSSGNKCGRIIFRDVRSIGQLIGSRYLGLADRCTNEHHTKSQRAIITKPHDRPRKRRERELFLISEVSWIFNS